MNRIEHDQDPLSGDPQLGRAFAGLRKEAWRDRGHRAALEQQLLRAARRPSPRASKPRRGSLLATVLLTGAVAASPLVWKRIRIATRIDGRAPVASEVASDTSGRGTFEVPLSQGAPDRFEFEIEGSDAPWISFDITTEEGKAVIQMQEHAAHPLPLEEARSVLSEARALATADAGRLWGSELSAPVLLVEPEAHFAVSDRADAEGRLLDRDGLFYGRLPAEVGIANTAIEWSGTLWTMLRWPLPSSEAARGQLLMHEAFHALQGSLGIPQGGEPCAHLEEEEARIDLRLEALALEAALVGDEGERKQAALDALAFRERRRSVDALRGKREDALEVHEGSAEYTGLRLGGQPESLQRKRAVAALRGLPLRTGLPRSFAYLTGPAWGLLLDDLSPGWHARLAASNFTQLARGALGSPVVEVLVERASRRESLYGADRVRSEERERAVEQKQRTSELRARFHRRKVLAAPLGETHRMTFDPYRVISLPGVGTWYGTLWVSDAWGEVQAQAGAVVTDQKELWLPAPSPEEGLVLEGDGWTLELGDGWVRRSEQENGERLLPVR